MDKPRLVGDGPATCSTSLDLVRVPEWVADVNGYYRDLGVDPGATRGQISRAYRERGLDDAHLTFVVTQLLNPAVRRAYDLTPMGHVFLDAEVAARLRHRLAGRVSVARARVQDEAEGFSLAGFPSVIDKPSWSGHDAPQALAWSWSHYLWGTDSTDAVRLQHWQEALVAALGRAGVRMKIAVGIMGGPQPEVEVSQVGSRTVVFFHEQCRSTDALVRRAVSQLMSAPSYPSEKRDRKMSETKPSFRRGTDEAKEASKGASFARTHYFSLDGNPHSPNNSAIIRFLTDYDRLIVVDQHNNVPTKPAPKDYEGTSWPAKMSAVCRKDKAFTGMYSDCFIDDHLVDGKNVKRATGRSWAYAVLREEVVEDGEVVGYRDQVREVAKTDDKGKPTGETYMEKAIVVVNMGYKNFFSIVEGFGKHFKTLLDRDYLIKRNGTDTDTTYNIIPMDPIVVDDQGKVFDLRLPEFADRYQPAESLEDLVADRASDEFYARFFDTRVEAKASTRGSKAETTADAPERPETDVAPDRMKAMAERVKNFGAAAKEGDAAPEAPAAEPATEPAAAAPAAAKAKTGKIRNFD